MEKLYTEKQYADMAVKAQEMGKYLYRVQKEIEYEIDVPEFKVVGYKNEEKEVFDEETKEFKTIMVEVPIEEPVMVEVEDELTGEKTLVQKTHKETRTKTVEVLEIQEFGYYVCSSENITDGIVNDNFETEKAQKELAKIDNLHITKQDFYNLFCKPVGITYDILCGKITELNMQAEWELCNHIYYGVVKPFLAALPLGKTEEEIIEIFETHNAI